jgi:hypothetical protein
MSNTPPKGIAALAPVPAGSSPERKRQLLEDWHRDANIATIAHRLESRRLGRFNLWLGLLLVVLTMLSTVLSAVTAKGTNLGIFSTVVSALAAVLAGWQAFLRPSDKSAESHQVAARYSSLLRRLKVLLAKEDPADSEIDALREDLDRVARGLPMISDGTYKKAREEFESQRR